MLPFKLLNTVVNHPVVKVLPSQVSVPCILPQGRMFLSIFYNVLELSFAILLDDLERPELYVGLNHWIVKLLSISGLASNMVLFEFMVTRFLAASPMSLFVSVKAT